MCQFGRFKIIPAARITLLTIGPIGHVCWRTYFICLRDSPAYKGTSAHNYGLLS